MNKKAPIAVLITDTHLKYETVKVVESIFEQVHEVCSVRGIGRIIHLGDFFTSRKAQDLDTLLSAKKIFDSFDNVGSDFIIIPGNHDKVLYADSRSFLDLFSNNIIVYREPSMINIEGVDLLMMPFFATDPYVEKFTGFVKGIPVLNRKEIVVLTHIGFKSTSNNDNVSIHDGVDLSLFKDFKAVYSGHIHNKNYPYLGSAYQQNFGENTEKGCHLLFDDGSIEFIQLDFPIYKTTRVSANEINVNFVEKFKVDNSESFYNRLFITGTREECQAINKSLLNESGLALKVVYEHESVLVIPTEESDNAGGEIVFGHTAESIVEEFSIFIEKQSIEVTDYMVDKVEILLNN